MIKNNLKLITFNWWHVDWKLVIKKMDLMKLVIYLLVHTRKHSILLQNFSLLMMLGLCKNDVTHARTSKNTILLKDPTNTYGRV